MNTFRLLLITNELYPYLNANSEIVYRIAEYLTKKGNEISILGYSSFIDNRKNICPFVYQTFHIDSIEKGIQLEKRYYECLLNHNLNKKNSLHKIIKLIFKPNLLTSFIKYKHYKKKDSFKEYNKSLKKILKNYRFDCIVAFSEPRSTIFSLYSVKTAIPKIFYKLDALSTNYYAYRFKDLFPEEQADKEASAIITTDLIFEEYQKGLIKGFDEKKIFPLEFPNIIDHRKKVERKIFFDNDHIHCVFAGGFYKDIRNPEYLLKMVSDIAKNDRKILFHFFGNLSSFIKQDRLPDNVIDHGKVNSDTALQNMMAADVLINVGNTVLNQLPSKILTYISLGKPILNIIKNPECPTLKYTNKYPLALNVLEAEEVLQKDIDRVTNFILDNKGKEIPFETIEALYHECTPEYVGDRVYEIIENVVENKSV